MADTTSDLLKQYRMAYGLEAHNNQAQPQTEQATQPEQPTLADLTMRGKDNALNWAIENEGFKVGAQNFDTPERLRDFQTEFEKSPLITEHGERLQGVVNELLEAINDPNSPIDQETAVSMFKDLFEREFLNGGDK